MILLLQKMRLLYCTEFLETSHGSCELLGASCFSTLFANNLVSRQLTNQDVIFPSASTNADDSADRHTSQGGPCLDHAGVCVTHLACLMQLAESEAHEEHGVDAAQHAR